MGYNARWPFLADPAAAARRAAARKRYLHALKANAVARRLEIARAVAAVVEEKGHVPRGFYTRLARKLKISKGQLSRDLKIIRYDEAYEATLVRLRDMPAAQKVELDRILFAAAGRPAEEPQPCRS
jgi:hypothetical protein